MGHFTVETKDTVSNLEDSLNDVLYFLTKEVVYKTHRHSNQFDNISEPRLLEKYLCMCS